MSASAQDFRNVAEVFRAFGNEECAKTCDTLAKLSVTLEMISDSVDNDISVDAFVEHLPEDLTLADMVHVMDVLDEKRDLLNSVIAVSDDLRRAYRDA